MLRSPRRSLALFSAVGLLSSSPAVVSRPVPRAAPSAAPRLAERAPRLFSDPIGCYALIDRVEIQDEGDVAISIQIWGAFAMTDGANGPPGYGMTYLPAERGYLYYTMNANERVTTAEWQDMKSIAGTGQIIGFGGRYEHMGRIRPTSEPASKPDSYPAEGWGGFVKGEQQWTGNEVVADLYAIPAPVAPAEGARVAAGAATLVAKAVRDTTLRMVFEIESASHAKESSGPLPIAGNKVSWTPTMRLAPGQTYVWRVSTTSGPQASHAAHPYVSRPATTTFRVTP